MIVLSELLSRNPKEIISWRHRQPLTVADLVELADKLALAILQHSHVQKWGVSTSDSFHFVASLLALFCCNKHPVLLSSTKNQYIQELRPYFDALITDENVANDTMPIVNINTVATTDLTPAPSHNLLALSQQLTLTLFTSGSTGLPKPIIKSIAQFQKESQLLIDTWGSTLQTCLIVASVSHQHLYGLTFKIMLSLALKCPFVCETVQYQEQLSQYHWLNNQQQKIVLIASPATLKNVDLNLATLPCLHVFSAGGPLSFEEAQNTLRCFGVLPNEIYGSSETGIIATRQQTMPTQPWQTFPTVQIRQHQDGTLSVLSPLLPNDKPEQLSDKITLINDQLFQLSGRTDNIVKIAEQRISLTYLEKQLTDLPEIEHAAPIVLTHNQRNVMAAVIVLSAIGKQQQQQLGDVKLGLYLRQQLRDAMPLIALPKRWRFVAHIPTNHQGKRAYLDLKELFT